MFPIADTNRISEHEQDAPLCKSDKHTDGLKSVRFDRNQELNYIFRTAASWAVVCVFFFPLLEI